ncbi:MAG: TIGR04551 family protein [Deltaproteobacteria bacterium]|nr:TIGR04551 family protein [Deltaproteobacteria bacterium]
MALAIVCVPALAAATGFTDIGQDIVPTDTPRFEAAGTFRLRTAGLDNLDLDRGPTPSGQLLFPVPLSDPNGQWLTAADLRLRTDLAAYAPGGIVAVKARLDILGDLAAGGLPDGVPSASHSQLSPTPSIRVRRAYGEALLPFGLIVAGRTGDQWGLGMLTNGGDCADCDDGDVADRIALISPIAGYIWALSYDFSSSGPLATERDGIRQVDIDPTVDVRTVTFAFLNWNDPAALVRRRKAGLLTFNYGAYASYRWQPHDLPASYLALAAPVNLDGAQVVDRGFQAAAFDGWFRLIGPRMRVEAEAALLLAKVDQASLIPGVEYNVPVTSTQLGFAEESDFGAPEDPFSFGLDLGYASGDPAPGFGAFPQPNQAQPVGGDLDGPQANPPYDTKVDNFKFSSDYKIDRILFAEIIGTVTDAIYFRPHARYRIAQWGVNQLTAQVAAIYSRAVFANSTPGGDNNLGVEVDPTISYGGLDGFNATLEYAALFPLAGFNNVVLNLTAQPAQLVRLRLTYVF